MNRRCISFCKHFKGFVQDSCFGHSSLSPVRRCHCYADNRSNGYPLELCETLCKRCHAADGEIPPVGGWECVGEDDLGGLYENCDLCHAELRYVFYVQQADWDADMFFKNKS
jgi:hypothetical protein